MSRCDAQAEEKIGGHHILVLEVGEQAYIGERLKRLVSVPAGEQYVGQHPHLSFREAVIHGTVVLGDEMRGVRSRGMLGDLFRHIHS